MTGQLIVFEGPEGGGKSLQLGRLADTLEGRGCAVVRTREPGGTAIGNRIRQILLDHESGEITPATETLLLAAARAQHVSEVIGPAIERGQIVLCDRFVASTYAYQGGGHGLPMPDLTAIQQFATGGVTATLNLLLDVPVQIGLDRRHADAGSVNRIDLASVAFHERVRASFLAMAEADPCHWAVIDARDKPDSVQLAIWRRVSSHLALA